MKRPLGSSSLLGWSMAAAVLAFGCAARVPADRGGSTSGSGSGGTAGMDPAENVEVVKTRCESSTVGAAQLRRLTRSELQNTIVAVFPELGADWLGVKMGPDPTSRFGFTNDASVLIVGTQTAKEILDTAQDVATRVTDELGTILPCSTTTADAACATEFIERYAPRLFRRPVSADEQQRYASYHASVLGRSDFKTATKWTLVALLQSPHAVYRSEIGTPAGTERKLTQHEIASQLSYTFAQTAPSAELLEKAERDELSTPSALVAEARRLLATPSGQEALHRFFREWVGYPKVEGRTKDTLPDFAAYKHDMIEETRRFVDEVVFKRGGGVSDLLTAPYTMLNANLAAFYGYGSPAGDYALVNRPPEYSIGILAQGSVLAGYAHGDSSSPTLRGLLVYERLFCNQRDEVPANVPNISEPQPGAKTTRQRYEEVHMAQGQACTTCHLKSDPPGFAFEHFDETGRYRADEGGLPIDTAATMINRSGDEIMTFDGLTDLVSQAAEIPEVTDCVSGLLAAYAFGGPGHCLAEEARDALQAGEYGLADYFAELAGAPHFTRRSAP